MNLASCKTDDVEAIRVVLDSTHAQTQRAARLFPETAALWRFGSWCGFHPRIDCGRLPVIHTAEIPPKPLKMGDETVRIIRKHEN